MKQLSNLSIVDIFIIFLLTSCCALIFFICEGFLGFNLSDEAFLLYGATAVNHGSVPIRDFYAYDPGRYYLTAFVMRLVSDHGIVASRIAEVMVQGLGLFLALILLVRSLPDEKKLNPIYMLLTTLTLLMWMAPLYKSFDFTASIALIALLVYLIEANTLSAVFWAGVGLSIIAIIGRNHGIYGAAASIGVMTYMSLMTRRYSIMSALTWWIMGLFVGYLPILLMMLFVPGFGAAFIEGIYFIFASKATNLYLPIPWPWHATTLQGLLMGLFFNAIALVGIASVVQILLVRKKTISPVLIACAFLMLPYAHYAFSRADVHHLALGIFPFLIYVFAYLHQNFNSKIFILTNVVILLTLSCIVMAPLHPGVQAYLDKNWQDVDITGSTIKVDGDSANKIEMFKRLVDQYAPNGQAFLVAPFNFGMYSIFDRKSPMWDLYPLFMRSANDQTADIARIQQADPAFVVIYDEPLDGQIARQFHNTHPLIFKYIEDNFELIHDVAEREYVYIYKRKSIG